MIALLIALAAEQQASPPNSNKSDPNKMICRLETNVGSRIPERTCHTKAEWDQLEKDTREDVQNARRFGNYGDPASSMAH